MGFGDFDFYVASNVSMDVLHQLILLELLYLTDLRMCLVAFSSNQNYLYWYMKADFHSIKI